MTYLILIWSNIFVCQKELIINNPKAYNCCDFNFTNNECNIHYIPEPFLPTKDTYSQINTDSPKVIDTILETEIPKGSNFTGGGSSSGINIGAIIGIIGGALAVIIAIGIIIFCFCRKKRKEEVDNKPTSNSINLTEENPDVNNTTIINLRKSEIYDYELNNKTNDPNVQIILVVFVTTAQYRIGISIKSDKTMKELIKFYFKTIKRPELFGDKSIVFLLNSKLIEHDSKDKINDYIKNKNQGGVIVVNDIDDKIEKNLIKK